MTTALEGCEGSASRPGRSLPRGKTRYLLYRRLGGPQCPSGQVRKISPAPEFDHRTVQPVASRYTDYGTRPTLDHDCTINTEPMAYKIGNVRVVTQSKSTQPAQPRITRIIRPANDSNSTNTLSSTC